MDGVRVFQDYVLGKLKGPGVGLGSTYSRTVKVLDWTDPGCIIKHLEKGP